VATVAVTSHLGVLVAAWTASSLALHQLLTFYRERPAAQVVAHKKFLASRLADACLLAALWLLHRETGTLSMPEIAAQLPQMAALPATLHAAALLVALAAVLKSAQLPLHGWLIQVMEAPTPVSALLHAGIVNLGGFVLIRLAALLSAAPAAQALLVGVGASTALLAGLVMMTRVSIKVRLAWSTCAQMGFMLVECGLGLYELAMLHLVAHSVYKAHAFLAAGEAVHEARSRDFAPARFTGEGGAATLAVRFAAVPVALTAVWASAAAWQAALPGFQLHPAALAIAGLGLAPLLWGAQAGARLALSGLARLLGLVQLYFGWHLAFAAAMPPAVAPAPLLAGFAVLCIAALYGLQAWLPARPGGALARALHPLAFAGFHLDERFTRLTFRVWPAARVAAAARAGDARPIAFHGEQ
jgi:NAD(P)H-quinone oxidoreductase subunit 5